MHRISGKLTYSNVISTLCLVLLVGGGTAYAASELGKESVGSKQLAKGAVTPSKLSKSSRNALTGPAGAKGATGATGATGNTGAQGSPGIQGNPGTPGSALAYARVSATGVMANSKNVTSVEVAGSSLFCFHLPFTPENVVATGETYSTDQPNPNMAGEKPTVGAGLGKGETACPTGTSAYVATSTSGGSNQHLPFFVLFN